jgi:CheY-like chemotaxis protein
MARHPLVLVVEDDQDLREALSLLVEASGVAVSAARDGMEAVELLRSGPLPAAVFLDKTMPRLDGAGVLAVMLADPALASVPVVWMSGDRGHPAAVARHLLKPFDPEALVSILGDLCEAS